jgi:hypothetical protein
LEEFGAVAVRVVAFAFEGEAAGVAAAVLSRINYVD